MIQTKESFTKDVNNFFDHLNAFKTIAHKRSTINISNPEILSLFKIFMDHHKYIKVNK